MAGRNFDDLLPQLTEDDLALMDGEVSYLRELVGRGEVLAIAGGAVMAWWGLVLAISTPMFVLRYMEFIPAQIPLGILQMLAGYAGSIYIGRIRLKQRMTHSWQSEAISTIWVFAAVAIGVVAIGSMIGGHVSGVLQISFLCIIFSIVIAAMGASGRRKWLLWPAAGWMASAFIILSCTQEDDVIIRQSVMCVSSLAFMLAPGVFLTMSEKRI
jgi:hypothetical protein